MYLSKGLGLFSLCFLVTTTPASTIPPNLSNALLTEWQLALLPCSLLAKLLNFFYILSPLQPTTYFNLAALQINTTIFPTSPVTSFNIQVKKSAYSGYTVRTNDTSAGQFFLGSDGSLN